MKIVVQSMLGENLFNFGATFLGDLTVPHCISKKTLFGNTVEKIQFRQ